MEFDIRVKAVEIIGNEPPRGEGDIGEEVTLDDYPLTPQEQEELREAIEGTLRSSTFFTGDWDNMENVRTFMVRIPFVRAHV